MSNLTHTIENNEDSRIEWAVIAILPSGEKKWFAAGSLAAKELNLSRGLVCQVLKKERPHTKNIKFKYAKRNSTPSGIV